MVTLRKINLIIKIINNIPFKDKAKLEGEKIDKALTEMIILKRRRLKEGEEEE